MKIISVINYKGGVGKTTLTANLGAELAFRGYRILLLDLDPQASLTFSFIKPDDWKKNFSDRKTIKAWFDSFEKSKPFPLEKLIFTPSKAKARIKKGILKLIPSDLGLINVDLELASELGGANLKQSKRNYIKVHKRLAQGLKEIKEEFDIVLIDCPPNFNIVTKNAIIASDNILIPAKPDYLSTLGIDYLHQAVKYLIKDFNEFVNVDTDDDVKEIHPKILGVVFTMVQYYGEKPISTIRPFISQTKRLDVPVFNSRIRENKSLFADSPQYGEPVILINYSNKTYKNVVKEMEDFVTEFLDKL